MELHAKQRRAASSRQNTGGRQSMQLFAKQTPAHLHCGIAYLRTYGRTGGSDVMT